MRAEQVTDPIAYHGEGPVWAASWGSAAEGVTAGGGLRWVDMLAGDVLSLRADGTVDRTHVGDVAAALRPRAGGGAVVAVERGFALISPEGELTTLPELWGADAGIRMNEGGCDPDGRFHCGTMAYAKTPGAANLYRLAPGPDGGAGEVDVVLTGATTSNGLEWSPDGTRAYYNDTPTRQVAVFDYSREEGLTNWRVLVDVLDGEGKPDGLTVDAEGGIWVAVISHGQIHRYTPEGTLDEVVEVPVQKTTACTFGGDDLGTLYITTSWENLERGEDPLAGALFAVRPGVTGLPARPFAG